MSEEDRTASLMTPAKLAKFKPKPAASPAAWLDQMASDAGRMHLVRLEELAHSLRQLGEGRDSAPLSAALVQLEEALARIDFALLQPKGLLARMTGKNKSAGAEFAGQYEHAAEAARGLAAQAQQLAQAFRAGDAASERALVEFEVEYRALDKIIDQGARWLQDMRTQLKARHAAAADEQSQQQVKEDAARCELLVARLKLLRAASSAAQDVHKKAQEAAARRQALVQMLQQAVGADVKAWQQRLAPLASSAGDGQSPALSLEGPRETQRELQLCARQAVADCAQLQAHERQLAEGLSALAAQLAGG